MCKIGVLLSFNMYRPRKHNKTRQIPPFTSLMPPNAPFLSLIVTIAIIPSIKARPQMNRVGYHHRRNINTRASLSNKNQHRHLSSTNRSPNSAQINDSIPTVDVFIFSLCQSDSLEFTFFFGCTAHIVNFAQPRSICAPFFESYSCSTL